MASSSPIGGIRIPQSAFEDLRHLTENADHLPAISVHILKFVSRHYRDVVGGLVDAVGLPEVKIRGMLNATQNITALADQFDLDSAELLPAFTKRIESAATDEWKAKYLGAWKKALPGIATETRFDGPLATYYKARILTLLHEKNTHNMRIVTDIRPVFNRSGTDATAGIIVHRLIVDYVADDSDQHKTIVLALDSGDIDRLMGLCERAKTKRRVLAKKIQSLEWITVDFGDNE